MEKIYAKNAVFSMLVASALTGCAPVFTETSLEPRVCESWQEIRPSRKDAMTDETAKQIVGNNEARKAWCASPPRFASLRDRT